MSIKRFFVFLISFVLTASCAFSKEAVKLVSVKNIQKSALTSIIDNELKNKNYNIVLKDDYYILPKTISSSGDYYIIMAKQNGNDCYLYFLSNAPNNDFEPIIFGNLKNNKYKYKNISNKSVLSLFYSDALALKNNANYKSSNQAFSYDFSDEAQAKFDSQNNKYSGITVERSNVVGTKVISSNKNVVQTPVKKIVTDNIIATVPDKSQPQPLKGSVLFIPQGASFDATLQSAITSESIAKSDTITAVLPSDWVYNGSIIAPQGSILYGKITDVENAGLAYKNGTLGFTFNQLLTPKGTKIQLSTNKVVLGVENSSRGKKIAANVAVGSLIGLASGAMYAVLTGGDIGGALAIGAGMGAASGGMTAVMSRGENVELKEGANLNIRLIESMSITPYN